MRLSSAGGHLLVHHAWTKSLEYIAYNRRFEYRVFDVASGEYGEAVFFPEYGVVAGYLDLATTGDNRAVIGGHQLKTIYSSSIVPFAYWQDSALGDTFPVCSRPPDSVIFYAVSRARSLLWTRMAYAEGPYDTVLHMVAQKDLEIDDPCPLYYLRRVGAGPDSAASWDYPPFIVDTMYAWGVHQIVADDAGRVAIAWAADVPCPGDPDTLSGVGCWQGAQRDMDIYLIQSYDYGVTWQPRRNLTRYSEDPDSKYRAHSEITMLFDESGELHVMWAAADWPPRDPYPGEVAHSAGALFHWSEFSDRVTPVYDFNWNQTVCNGGNYGLNVGDVSLAECNGKLFAVFCQFNDPAAGIMNDCSVGPAFPDLSAVADIWVTVSSDDGLHWDGPRNITNSHTPGCDSIGGVVGPCAAEMWPSIDRYGTAVYIDPAVSGADIIVPAGGVDPGWYVDVQYVDDPSAGFSNDGLSFLQPTTLRWFRLACVDPILMPRLTVTPDSVRYPIYVSHCEELRVPVVVSNLGNTPGEYSVVAEELTGPSGWLGSDGFDGTVAADPLVGDTGFAVINADGLVCEPGAIVRLTGRLRFDSNDPTGPHFAVIDVVVADTVWAPSVDTISTACLSLQVRNDGGAGARGEAGVGMDFSTAGDCEPLALIYLSDASPILMRTDLGDTAMGWSAYNCGYRATTGLVPLESSEETGDGFAAYHSHSAVADTTVHVETSWWAPQQEDSCRFLIQRMRIFGGDAQTHTVTSGQLIDWDIPSDSGARNGSDTLAGEGVIYQYGGEFDQDIDECQDNDRRFGGVFPLGMYRKTNTHESFDAGAGHMWQGAVTRATSQWVSPQECGLDPAELCAAMTEPEWGLYVPPVPESAIVDLHTLVTYVADYPLTPGETLVVYSGFAVVMNGDAEALRGTVESARQWYCDRLVPEPPGCGCCDLRGDVNQDGKTIVSDVTALVYYLFRGGPPPACREEADANADGSLKVSDLTYLVTFLFRAGAAPPPC